MFGYSIGSNHIGGGGGGGGTTVTEKDVNFYDYDGTLVAGYTIAEANALSALPDGPDRTADGLTFQEWNYTLSEVNATASDLDVGATYITTDGKTHLYITLTTVSGLAPTLYLNKSDGSTLSVDWGDTNTSTFTNSGNFNTGAHTYSAAGDYVVKLWISSGSGAYGLGNETTTSTVVGGSTAVYQQTLTKLFIGDNVTSFGKGACYNSKSLEYVTLPSGILSVGMYALDSCYSLKAIVFPSGMTTIDAYSVEYCRCCFTISIPNSVTTIATDAFHNNSLLDNIVFPQNITAINNNLFNGCVALTKITIYGDITSIGTSSFYGCWSLDNVIIGNNVTSIGGSCFYSCYNLREITFLPSTPPTCGTNIFEDVLSILTIKVPAASLSAYQSATNLSTYADYMEGY